MTKEQIVDIIKKYVVENLGTLKAEEIDIHKPMADYGANSLDVIEVVSCTMRELKIRVPREELNNIKNISELAETFLAHCAK